MRRALLGILIADALARAGTDAEEESIRVRLPEKEPAPEEKPERRFRPERELLSTRNLRKLRGWR